MVDVDRMRLRRLELRMSQGDLGKAIGQDQAYISKIERGQLGGMTVLMLERLADTLQVSTDYLLGREAALRPRARKPAPVS
jgi:transcriptional regulator with XRE-family HTH domain